VASAPPEDLEWSVEALYPDVDVPMWDLYHSGQPEKAREIFSKRLLMVYTAQQIPGTGPYITKKRGVFKTARSRREGVDLTAGAMQYVDFQFEALRPYLRAYK
jgi:hypothetical protein